MHTERALPRRVAYNGNTLICSRSRYITFLPMVVTGHWVIDTHFIVENHPHLLRADVNRNYIQPINGLYQLGRLDYEEGC